MPVRDLIEDTYREGDIARAYELCRTALLDNPGDLWIRHRAVLCLIKSGALDRAWTLFKEFGLDQARQDEDCLSIGARLHKARAFEASPNAMPLLAREAATRYAAVFMVTGGHYPAINAASLFLAAGEPEMSRAWARRVLEMRGQSGTQTSGEAAYYRGASEAEAYLLLGDLNAARLSLAEAVSRDPDNLIAQATTRWQLRWVCDRLRLSEDVISWPDLPRPMHYAGHIFASNALPAEETRTLEARLDQAFEDHALGPAFGAIAAGADIFVAEAVLRHRRSLHIVLPVPVEVFMDSSVLPFGKDWRRRADRVLADAADVLELSSDRRILSPANLNFASDVAMGLARMRADVLATRPVQLLLCEPGCCDGEQAAFGTVRDAATWRASGLEQEKIDLRRNAHSASLSSPPAEPASGFKTVMRAMLFIDVANSTNVPDDKVGIFVRDVLGAMVAELDQLDLPPLYRDSWGDGLFLAFEAAEAAAEAAIRVRQAFAALDQDALGMPERLEIRIGAHYGPVHLGEDPLQRRTAPFGAQVAVASRMERAAVPGSIFTSEAFAAVLTMETPSRFKCEYVGRREIDRNMPEMALYVLRRIAADSLDAQSSAPSLETAG